MEQLRDSQCSRIFRERSSRAREAGFDGYEQARLWTLDHQSEARQILAGEAKLTDAVASKVWDRTDLTNSAIGPVEEETIRASGDILKQSQVIDPGTEIDRVVADLIDPEFFPGQVSEK